MLGPAVHRGKDTTHTCVMSVRGPNNVRRAVQTDPTLLRYASAITEQKKCWELLAEKFDRFQTLRRVCKRTQHVTSNNVGSCWPTMLRPFARGLRTPQWNSLNFYYATLARRVKPVAIPYVSAHCGFLIKGQFLFPIACSVFSVFCTLAHLPPRRSRSL